MLKLYKKECYAKFLNPEQPNNTEPKIKKAAAAAIDTTYEYKFPKETMQFFEEIMEEEGYQPENIIANAVALDGQMELHLPGEYNAQCNYMHSGKRESYILPEGEGEVSKLVFADRNFSALKRNFALKTGGDPYSTPTRTIRLPALDGTETHYVNPAFWEFVVKEFELKQWKRTIEDEERSNGFKRHAHRHWWDCYFKSEECNAGRLPPKADPWKKPLGTQ